jgi:hypothetical protein
MGVQPAASLTAALEEPVHLNSFFLSGRRLQVLRGQMGITDLNASVV